MNFRQHFSGSGGNLYEVRSGERRLLIDCGVPWNRLLTAIEHDISTIDGCLLTHCHEDHSKAFSKLAEYGVDIYSSEETFREIDANIRHSRMICLDVDKPIGIGAFTVFPFDLNHVEWDKKTSEYVQVKNLGFLVSDGREWLFFAVDTALIVPTFEIPFAIIAIECSYDTEALVAAVERKERPDFVAERMISSHMEWRTTKRYLDEFCNLSRCREIHLLHMSGTLPKEMVVDEFKKTFGIEVVTV